MATAFKAPRTMKRTQADDASIEMPNDVEAEEALLGSLLIDRSALAEVKAEIPNFCAEHFYRPLHKHIFQALEVIGSNDTVSIAGYLKDHGVEDATLAVGLLVNRVTSSDYAVSAAWRVYDKARSRAQIGVGQAMMMAGLHGDLAKFDELMALGEKLKEDYVPPAARPLNVRSMREIMQTEYPEVRMLVEKLIQQGVVTLFAGKAKAGKSFWMLAAAFAVAEASQNAFGSYDEEGNVLYHGLHCQQSRVLYMALEDTERRIKNRTIKMRGELTVPEFVDVATEAPRIDEGVINQLELYLDAHPDCKLIIIDTLLKILPPPSRNGGYAEDYINLAGLRNLAHRRDVAIMPIIHCRKADGSDVFDTIQTTMGTQAAAENLIVLQRRRGEDRAILHATGNDIGDEALAMKFNSEKCTWSILGEADKVAENEQEELIFDTLDALGGSGKLGKIAELLKGEMAFAQVRTMLYRMSTMKPNSPVKNKLVNEGGEFRKNTDLTLLKSTFENVENIEKRENAEKPENLFSEDASATISDFSAFSDFSDFSTFSKVEFTDQQEHEEGSLNGSSLIDEQVLAEVSTLIADQVRTQVLRAAQENGWKQIPIDGWPRGGGAFSWKKIVAETGLDKLWGILTSMQQLGWQGV